MDHHFRKVSALLLAMSTIGSSTAMADPITLTTLDEQVRLRGEFLGFAQNAYIVEINGSRVHVPATLMTCEGVDCIDFQPKVNASDNG